MDFCRCMRLKWYFRDEPTPFLVSDHLLHLSHPRVHHRATLTQTYFLVKLNISYFGFLIKILLIRILPRRSGKPLDLSLMIDLQLSRELIKYLVQQFRIGMIIYQKQRSDSFIKPFIKMFDLMRKYSTIYWQA